MPDDLTISQASSNPTRPILFRQDTEDLLALYLLKFDRHNTRRSYAADLKHFFASETIVLEQVRRVSFVDVNEFLSLLNTEGAKPATVQRKSATLRGFFSWLVALGLLAHNPADRQLVRRVRRVSAQDRVVTSLTREQSQALVDAVDLSRPSALRDRTLLVTLLHSVLRRSEAAAMDFSHIRRIGRHWVLELPETKGGADQFVKLPEHVVTDINAMRVHYAYGPGPVWRSFSRNSFGSRLSAAGIYEIVRSHARKAGIDADVGAHTLRHTGCTLAVEAGASIQQVQAHARHKQLQTTMIYVHQRNKLEDNAADYIDIGL